MGRMGRINVSRAKEVWTVFEVYILAKSFCCCIHCAIKFVFKVNQC